MSAKACTPTRYIGTALILAAAQVGGGLLLTFARVQGMIEAETATRGVMILIGLSLAVWGNLVPKMLEGPPRTVSEAATAQSVLRFTGWAMTIAGVLWSALWGFAPREVAHIAGVAVVVLSAVATIIFTVLRYRAGRGSGMK